MRIVRQGIVLLAVIGVVAQRAPVAWGDGGTVRLLAVAGPYRLTVFTDPTPLRTGPVDLSVLVQDAATGIVFQDCQIMVTLRSADNPTGVIVVEATSAAATNKLMKSAIVELPTAGRWLAEVAIDGPRGAQHAEVSLEAGAPLPPWRDVAVWVFAPLVPVGLFLLRELLAAGSARRLVG